MNIISQNNSLPNMIDGLTIDILVNERGEVIVGYDKDLGYELAPEYLEFDEEKQTIIAFTESGSCYDLGLEIFTLMGKYLMSAKEVNFLFIQNKQILKADNLPILVRQRDGV